MADDADTNSINNATADMTGLGNVMNVINGYLTNATKLVGSFGAASSQSANTANSALSGLQGTINNVKGLLSGNINLTSFTNLVDGIGKATMSSQGLTTALAAVAAAKIPTDMFSGFKTDSESAINSVNTHVDALQKLMSAAGAPKWIADAPKVFADNATQAQVLENNYISLMATQGKLNTIFSATDNKLVGLSSRTQQFTDDIIDQATAVGLDGKQAINFAGALGQIPGLMDSIIKTTTDGEDHVRGLEAAMRLMMGSGRSMPEVTASMTTAFEELGQAKGKLTNEMSSTKEVEYFSTISTAANQLGLRFKDVQAVLDGVSKEFVDIGDNTAAAANILGQYSNALQATGLTSTESTVLTGKLIKNVTELTVAQKAYISAQAGGPGGLQGAFKIEQMMREGKTDDVMAMTEKVIKQRLGGRIYGLNEAAQGGEAASQFMRQRTMLQSGVFGVGKGFSDDQATHLLEALRDKNTTGFTEMITGTKAVADVMAKSHGVQEQNQDISQAIANHTEKMAVDLEIIARSLVKQYAGSGDSGEGRLAATNRKVAVQASNAAINSTGGTPRLSFEDTEKQIMQRMAQSGKDILSTGKMSIKAYMAQQAPDTMGVGTEAVLEAQSNRTRVATAAMRGRPNTTPMAQHYLTTSAQHPQQQIAAHGAMMPHAGQQVLHVKVDAADGLIVTTHSNSPNVVADANYAARGPGARSIPVGGSR